MLYEDRLFHYSQRVYRDNTRINTPRANLCRISSSDGLWWSGGQRFSFGQVTDCPDRGPSGFLTPFRKMSG